jgi:hypothetical protein
MLNSELSFYCSGSKVVVFLGALGETSISPKLASPVDHLSTVLFSLFIIF